MKNAIKKIVCALSILCVLLSTFVIAPSASSADDLGWQDLPDTLITGMFVDDCSSTLTYLPAEVYMGYADVHCKELTLSELNRFIPTMNSATSSTVQSRFKAFREFLGVYREIYGTDSVFQTYYYLGKGFFMYYGECGDGYLYDKYPEFSMFTDMNLYVDWKYRTDDSMLLTFRVRCKNANTSTIHYDTPFTEVNLIYQFIVDANGAKCKKHWFSAQGETLDYELILYLDDDLNGVPERIYGEKYYEGMPTQITYYAFGLTSTSVRGASRTDLFACLYQTIFGAPQDQFFFSFPSAYSKGGEEGNNRGYQVGYNDGYAEAEYYIYGEVYDEAYNTGLDQGREEGYDVGHGEGYNAGLLYGSQVGYEGGFIDGQEYGEKLHEDDYQYGFDLGYLKGTNDIEESIKYYYKDYWSAYYNSEAYGNAVQESIQSNDSNPVTAFFNSIWNGLLSAYDTVTESVSVGGITLSSVITTLIIAAVVLFIVSKVG